MIEQVKVAGNRYARRFEPADRNRDLRVIHILARIGVPISSHDSAMTGPLPVQFMKILGVVSQQHPIQ